MRVIHLCRKPLGEGSVAANVLEHGTGGLNIEATRIGTTKEVPSSPSRKPSLVYSGAVDGSLRKGTGLESGFNPNVGRWPANVILQHRDGCRQAGTRQVKGSHLDHKCSSESSTGIYSPMNTAHKTGHTDADGKETIAAWNCGPGCPVADLDGQTGDLAPQGGQKHKDTMEHSFLGTGFGGSPTSTFYGDTGGASRFFKQVGGNPECE